MLTNYTKVNIGDEVVFIKNNNTLSIGTVVRKYYRDCWIKQKAPCPTLIRRAGEMFNLSEYKKKCLTMTKTCDIKSVKEIINDS